MTILKKIYSAIAPAPYGRIWRTWDFVRYDIPRFLRNTWHYRHELTNTFEWDAAGSLRFMKAHLEEVAEYLETRGHEVPESRLKKVEKIRRAIELLDLHLEERFTEWAEQEMGETLFDSGIYFEKIEGTDLSEMKTQLSEEEKQHNGRIYKRANEIAKETWVELFEILRGQDTRIYSIIAEFHKGDHKKRAEIWDGWFDGSGFKHWWD